MNINLLEYLKFCFGFLAETIIICIMSWNYVFSCFKFVELFIKITPSIMKIDSKIFFGKSYSAIIFLLQGNEGIK